MKIGVVGRGMGRKDAIMSIIDQSFGIQTKDLLIEGMMLEATQLTSIRGKLLPVSKIVWSNRIPYYIAGRAPIKHVVSKSYIDKVNERIIGKMYRETIKEGCNAFDILQFTRDRSTKCDDDSKGRKQTRPNTVGTPNGKDAHRYRFTFR